MSIYLVTGCNRGIGLALTRQILEDPAHEVIGSVRSAAAPFGHERFRTVRFDVRDADAVRAAAASVAGPIDVLVNNAGTIGPENGPSLGETDFEAFAETLDVNVLGPLRVTAAFLPHLKRSSRPRVMTISSELGSMEYSGLHHIAYRTSKAAVNKLMKEVAHDLRRDKIASVVAHPGWVRTDMGGPSAPTRPEDSAEGLLRLLDELTLANSGRFMDWNGRQRAW